MIINVKSLLNKNELLSAGWEPNDVSFMTPEFMKLKRPEVKADFADNMSLAAYCHFSSQIVFYYGSIDYQDLFIDIINCAALEQYDDLGGWLRRKIDYYKSIMKNHEDVSFKIMYPDGTSSRLNVKEAADPEKKIASLF